MKLLIVADALEGFNTTKDTTFAMMREASARGCELLVCQPRDLMWQRGGRVTGYVSEISLTPGGASWFAARQQAPDEIPVALADVDAVLMRKDPPFDSEYFYATHLLEQAEREGARVFNSPQALREHPEKLALMEFADFASPTLVTRSPQAIRDFHAKHSDIILKPLDGMGGMGIFRVKADGLNLGSIIETLNRDGSTSVMVQKFLPEIAQGDKRVLVIDGEPVPFALARIPQGNEVRGNLAAGGLGVAQELNAADRAMAQASSGPSRSDARVSAPQALEPRAPRAAALQVRSHRRCARADQQPAGQRRCHCGGGRHRPGAAPSRRRRR
jgi:glutathione synthase